MLVQKIILLHALSSPPYSSFFIFFFLLTFPFFYVNISHSHTPSMSKFSLISPIYLLLGFSLLALLNALISMTAVQSWEKSAMTKRTDHPTSQYLHGTSLARGFPTLTSSIGIKFALLKRTSSFTSKLRVGTWCGQKERRNWAKIYHHRFKVSVFLVSYVEELSYFGHTCREGGCQIVKAAILGLKGGRRTRGRPRLCYTDNVKEWLKPSSLKEAVALAQDHRSWRGLIGKVPYSVADHHRRKP